MLSDVLFESINDILEAVVDYDYTDYFKNELIQIISQMYNISSKLDKLDIDIDHDPLKTKKENLLIVKKMYQNAVKKRDMSSINFYDNII